MSSETGGSDDGGGNRSVMQNAVRLLSKIATALSNSFPQQTGTAATATGGAATLPANPVGFMTVLMPDGTTRLIPYYDA